MLEYYLGNTVHPLLNCSTLGNTLPGNCSTGMGAVGTVSRMPWFRSTKFKPLRPESTLLRFGDSTTVSKQDKINCIWAKSPGAGCALMMSRKGDPNLLNRPGFKAHHPYSLQAGKLHALHSPAAEMTNSLRFCSQDSLSNTVVGAGGIRGGWWYKRLALSGPRYMISRTGCLIAPWPHNQGGVQGL
jgi:hypothetical protein